MDISLLFVVSCCTGLDRQSVSLVSTCSQPLHNMGFVRYRYLSLREGGQ